MKIEGRADADHGNARERMAMLEHPALLFGRADTDEEQVCAGCENVSPDFLIFFGRERPEGRCVAASDAEGRKTPMQILFEEAEHFRAGAIKIDSVVVPGRAFAQMEHERGAINTLLVRTAEGPKSPNDGHAVGCGDVGGVEDFGKGGIVFGHDDAMDRGDADVMAGRVWQNGALRSPLPAKIDNFGVAGFANAGADDELFFGKHETDLKTKDS